MMKAMNQLLYQTLRTGRLTDALRKPADPVRLLLALSVAGVGTGVLLYVRMPELSAVPLLMQGLRTSAALRTLWDVFLGALLPMLCLLCGTVFCGSAAFGQPLLLMMLLSRGIAAGLSMAECFALYPFRRALYAAAVLVLPLAFCSLALLIYAVREAFSLSGKSARLLLRGQAEEPVDAEMRAFLLRAVTRLLAVILLSGAHTVLLWLMNDRLLRTV
ncbi:MAG: hypothetical protein IJ060_01365 [Oscillospiraceae bacterium]|nr:hypothetical protein [Oscillospiraceae bacterium]